MRVINFDEIKLEKQEIIDDITEGKIFVYPTDTIYGIGCNAQDAVAVSEIRKIKSRAQNPFSVIAPSVKWIKENCVVEKEAEAWLKKLPGPYTLIFKLKKDCVAKQVNPGLNTLGVRIPKHWIKDIVAAADVPIITTSVNKSGEDYMTSLENIDSEINGSVDFVLYEGEKNGKPSRIVDLTGKAKLINR
ncbi:MAG TPA: L-threonylcarbamoyladenylate synthase [Candidatus Nanoarchaeia archaeon]|nr:L-threonylcarbamoyladenylate synthase [Candidatus Nanoarchaeia archaeon]